LTNGFVGAVIVVILAFNYGVRRAAIFALGGLVSAPIVFGFWSQGYVDSSGGGGVVLDDLYRWEYISTNLRTSTIFTGTMLLVILPLAAVGLTFSMGWFRRAMLVSPIVVTVAAYSAYYVTNQHPRFYYVILPPLFVLEAAGISVIWDLVHRRMRPVSTVE